MKNKSILYRIFLFILVIVGLIAGFYFFLHSSSQQNSSQIEMRFEDVQNSSALDSQLKKDVVVSGKLKQVEYRYYLETGGQLIEVKSDSIVFQTFANRQVRVAGDLDGDVLRVSKIEDLGR